MLYVRLKIVEINFTNQFDWLFTLVGDADERVFIMNDSFYKANGLTSPITVKELDYLDKGAWVNAVVEMVGKRLVVIRLRP